MWTTVFSALVISPLIEWGMGVGSTTADSYVSPLLIRAVNGLGRVVGPRAVSLEAGSLMQAACRKSGLDDFGDDYFLDGLRALCRSLEEDRNLTFFGRIWARFLCLEALVNRLRIEDYLGRNPASRAAGLTRPLIITGLPRSGTTFLHGLLACDPKAYAPRLWELRSPCPAAGAGELRPDPRRTATKRSLVVFYYASPKMRIAHSLEVDRPDECFHLLQNTLHAEQFGIGLIAWGYLDWLREQDLGPAYRDFRAQLSILSQAHEAEHMVLKNPCHLAYLDALMAAIPNALIVQTHREPREVIPSIASLFALTQAVVAASLDKEKLGRYTLDYWVDSAAAAMRYRQRHPDHPVHDVLYTDLLRDPMATVEGIYRAFGLELDDGTREAMRAFVAANPQHKYGVHRYRAEDYGLDDETIESAFAAYRERYL